MAMLKKRKLVLALINQLPRMMGRQLGKYSSSTEHMITELQYLYGKLAGYDALMYHLGKVGI